MKIYEFLYNSSCCESSYATISIHKLRKGAEMALEFHKQNIKNEWRKDQEEFPNEYPYDFDQDWQIRETELLE